jgi:hypothetical protein
MRTTREKYLAIENAIAVAFRKVVLGRGISLRQAQAIDNSRHGISQEEFLALRRGIGIHC